MYQDHGILPKLKNREQEFIIEQLRDRFILRRDLVDTTSTRTLPSARELFQDIAKVIKSEPIDFIKNSQGVEQKLKTYHQDIDIEYLVSIRQLKELGNIKKHQLHAHTLNALYAYIGNCSISPKTFPVQEPLFYQQLSRFERKFLLDNVVKRFYERNIFEDVVDFYEDLYGDICNFLDRDLPVITISRDRIIGFIKGSEEEVSIAVLNTLCYYISCNELCYNEYRAEYFSDEMLAEQTSIINHRSHEKGDIINRESLADKPEIPLVLFVLTLSTGIVSYLFKNALSFDTVWLLIFFAGITFAVWYIILHIQSKQRNRPQKSLSKFWIWYNNELPIFLSKFRKRVNVLLVHDDSYHVQADLVNIRRNFKIVNIQDFVVTQGKNNELEEIACDELFDGMYILLTEEVYQGIGSTVDKIAAKRDDLPIVYVDYADIYLPYGRVESESASSGLWLLLTQSLRRVAAWKYRFKLAKRFDRGRVILLVFLLGVFFTVACLEHNSGAMLQENLENSKGNGKQLYQESLLLFNKDLDNTRQFWLRHNPELNPEYYNMSYFLRSKDGTVTHQLYRTDGESKLTSFELGTSVVGVVTNSYIPRRETIVALRDSDCDTMILYKFWEDGGMTPLKDAVFAVNQQQDRKDRFKGLMCASVGDVSTCIESIFGGETSIFEGEDGKTISLMLKKFSNRLDDWIKETSKYHYYPAIDTTNRLLYNR